MTSPLSQLLEDLYRIDPALREFEAELVPLIRKLQEARPEVQPSTQFVKELRTLLLQRAALEEHSRSSWRGFFALPHLAFALTGILLGIVLAVPLQTVLFPRTAPLPESPDAKGVQMLGKKNALPPPASPSAVTTQEDARAFGDLSTGGSSNNALLGRGGGGGGGMAQPPMIAPDGSAIRYEFQGVLPAIPKTVNVLQRRQELTAPELSQVVRAFDTGLTDLTSFQGMSVESAVLRQNVDKGYIVNIMFSQGQIGISPDWQSWPHPESACKDEACLKKIRPTLESLPSSEELIRIANDFTAAHGIDVSRYGKPEADTAWKQEFDRTADKSVAYIPDVLRVIYPLLIDGKPVYDLGGQKTGIAVGVSVRERKVSDVWGIQGMSFRSSSYDAADSKAIESYLKSLSDFGAEMPRKGEGAAKTVQLGAPEQGFALYYKNDGMQAQELIVPSLIFPVPQSEQDSTMVRRTVVVPLASDLLKVERPVLY